MSNRRFAHLLKLALLPFIATSLWISATFAQDSAPAERNRAFIEKAFERWAAGTGSFFQDVLAPDVTWTIKGSGPAAGTYHGREDFLERAVKPFAERLAAPIVPTVRDIWADGNDVVVHWDGVATAADGQPYGNSYVWILRMADQQAKEVIAFLDLAAYDEVLRRVAPPAAEG